jgi:4-amino-4-deoxy-L-arabinose transferase-like glycosyltransferase
VERLLKSERGLAGLLFLALLAQLLYGLLNDGLTDDEAVYVAAGWRHLHADFSINPEQPPLAKMIVALPLLALGPRAPETLPDDDQATWAYRFFHKTNRDLPLRTSARVPMVVLTLGLAAVVWRWARAAAGPVAGLIALALVAFQPALLAHGHLGTTDMPSAAGMVLASWLFARFLERPSLGGAVGLAVATAAAILTRLTAGVLGPVFVVLGLVELARSSDRGRLARWLLVAAALSAAVIPIVVVFAYAFHPAPFLEAVRFQIEHNARGHAAYLLGDRSRTGWWYYYLVVLLVKNTPGFLLALTATFALAGRRSAVVGRAHFVVPALAILVFASAGRIQIGERYILAAYPYLILWIATASAAAWSSMRGRLVLSAALLLHAVPALLIAPHGYLAYFNVMAGGREGGHRFLADSNLDWGQDLPRLAAWMRGHGVVRVQLGYFGSDDPDRYGIVREDLPSWPIRRGAPSSPVSFQGTVVVSPNLLLGYLVPPGRNVYEPLLDREPDARAGVFFVYDLGGRR